MAAPAQRQLILGLLRSSGQLADPLLRDMGINFKVLLRRNTAN
jgi:hypothetical protein